MLSDALTLQLGYNAALVAVGAGLLGMAAGAVGTFLFLGKRALVSDAISHATLPGIALAFMVMVAFGGDGRALPGLLLGAALSAGLGLVCVALVLALALLLRRPMLMVAFDPGYATAQGLNVRRSELAMMGLAMAITVVGLKIVGLILIVALLIVPPVAARFWSDRPGVVIALAGGIGGISGYGGAAISATAPGLPTGPIIVLLATAIFALSLLAAPRRGVLSIALRRRRVQA